MATKTTFTVKIKTDDLNDGLDRQSALETLHKNMTTEALEVLARLSGLSGINQKVIEKESIIKTFL